MPLSWSTDEPTAGPAPSRPARARTRAVVAALTGCAVLSSAGLAAPQVSAQTSPQDVLQAVEIDLGTDGTVHGLRSTAVSKDSSSSQVSTTRLDPAEHAGQLPVRITTSWSHDGRVGTDLSELEGVDGPVRVDITVQNTTVEAQRFRFDAAGASRDAYELVATPLTVVASATLPEGSFSQITQPPAGTTSPNATNGVVSTGEDGATTVQWASLLAPPRLAAATTFRLVQDARDFSLTDLTLSVQPGLATDASVSRLLGDAFGGSAALIGNENNTIALIAEINATLAEATDDLQEVRETLAVSANEVGAATTARLDTAASELDAAAAAVRSDLQSLDGSVAAALEQTRSASLTALSRSVQGLLSYLGTPGAAPAAAPPAGPVDRGDDLTCQTEPVQDTPAAPTLLGQLGQVSELLRAISGASRQCVAVIRASLAATIGDGVTCPAPGTPTAPLVCRLRTTSATLVGVAGGLAAEGARILGAFDRKAVEEVDGRIDELVGTVKGLQGRTASLRRGPGGPSTVDELAAILRALADDVAAATAATDPAASGGLPGALRALNDLAVTRRAAGGSAAVEAALDELAGQVCSGRSGVLTDVEALLALLPDGADGRLARAGVDSLKAELQAYSDSLRQRIDGQSCAPVTGADTGTVQMQVPSGPSLKQRVQASAQQDATAWSAVAASTDLSSATPTGAAAQLAALRGQLVALGDAVVEVQERLGGQVPAGRSTSKGKSKDDDEDDDRDDDGEDGPSLDEALQALVAQVDGLYDSSVTRPGCSTPAVTATSPLNALQRSFSDLSCNQRTVAQDLEGLLKTSLPNYDAAVASVDGAAAAALAASTAGDSQLSTLIGSLTGQLEESAALQLQQGDAVVREQRARLEAQRAAAERDLDSAAQAAIASLAAEIARSTRQQAAADSAGQTGVRVEQVVDVSQAASSYRGVRRAQLADAQLEQQQVARSLQAAQTVPPFALDLPAGSSYTSVFVVRVRPVG
jgi:trimeric autotransporter adhesin